MFLENIKWKTVLYCLKMKFFYVLVLSKAAVFISYDKEKAAKQKMLKDILYMFIY